MLSMFLEGVFIILVIVSNARPGAFSPAQFAQTAPPALMLSLFAGGAPHFTHRDSVGRMP